MNRFRAWISRALGRARRDSNEEPEGVRAFNLLTVWILHRLYDAFPERVDFDSLRDCIELVLRHLEYGGTSDELGAKVPRYYTDTMRWLETEGFIRVQSKTLDNKFLGVELTRKSLDALGRVPAAIAGRPEGRRLGEIIREAAVSESAVLARESVRLLVSAAVS